MCLSRVALWLRVSWSLEWLCSSALSISIGISAVCCGKHAKRTNSALRGGCCSEREKTAPPGTAVSKPAHKSTARTLLYALFFSYSTTCDSASSTDLSSTHFPLSSNSPDSTILLSSSLDFSHCSTSIAGCWMFIAWRRQSRTVDSVQNPSGNTTQRCSRWSVWMVTRFRRDGMHSSGMRENRADSTRSASQ